MFREPIALRCGTGKALLGDWAQTDGLACYSGGAVYRKTIRLERSKADVVELDLGKVSATCAVRVNGNDAAVLTAPPWKVDVGKWLKVGENEIEITVYNTLNNHYQTIPTRYKRPISQVPSGLLGPVKIREINTSSGKRAGTVPVEPKSRDPETFKLSNTHTRIFVAYFSVRI